MIWTFWLPRAWLPQTFCPCLPSLCLISLLSSLCLSRSPGCLSDIDWIIPGLSLGAKRPRTPHSASSAKILPWLKSGWSEQTANAIWATRSCKRAVSELSGISILRSCAEGMLFYGFGFRVMSEEWGSEWRGGLSHSLCLGGGASSSVRLPHWFESLSLWGLLPAPQPPPPQFSVQQQRSWGNCPIRPGSDRNHEVQVPECRVMN